MNADLNKLFHTPVDTDDARYLLRASFIKKFIKYLGGGLQFSNNYVIDAWDIVERAIANDEDVQAALDAYIDAATLTFGNDATFTENIESTEVVTTPSTSSTMTLVQKQLVHTVVGGGGTEEIPINVPDGSLLFSAEILVSEDLTFTTGANATATWTNSTQQIGATDALNDQNTKVTSFYDANADSAIATGTPETITLTADAGTIDGGEVVVVVRYYTLSGLSDVA